MGERTLKYYLDNRNFIRAPRKKIKKVEDMISVVDDQIILNSPVSQNYEEEIVTSYTYLNKKGSRKRWKPEENDIFFRALSVCGFDFSMINLLFPDRTRNNIKEKYKKEYRKNTEKVEEYVRRYKTFDIAAFNKLKEETSAISRIF